MKDYFQNEAWKKAAASPKKPTLGGMTSYESCIPWSSQDYCQSSQQNGQSLLFSELAHLALGSGFFNLVDFRNLLGFARPLLSKSSQFPSSIQ